MPHSCITEQVAVALNRVVPRWRVLEQAIDLLGALELAGDETCYAPFGKAAPTMNAQELHNLQQITAGSPGPQYTAGPQVAQLVAALLASKGAVTNPGAPQR